MGILKDLLNVAFENPRAIATAKSERQKALERATKNKAKKSSKSWRAQHLPIEELQLNPPLPNKVVDWETANTEPPIEVEASIYDVPDRITGRETLTELRKIHPDREWRFVEINVEYQVSTSAIVRKTAVEGRSLLQECQAAKPTVLDLMYPSDTGE
ncbi:hypothetical protein QFC22_004701 [Naganishia vaughanmartiniae]|uniref:Uncharacterized protein n=1 Tax=Naganishia vaughanmartiniae TaxID=1424756 RepID=A0ACC2X187_9TREE|nr:hypothetical protein QFC22_004701 [Naganishia vaughanmartiniae]